MAEYPSSWRDLVIIDPAFPPAQRAQLEQSLESIWQAADDEGKALLMAAASGNADGKLNIHVSTDGSKATPGNVEIDFMRIAQLQFGASGEKRSPSLTGILVHELYHAGDEMLQGGVGLSLTHRALAPMMRQMGYSEPDIQRLTAEYWKGLGVQKGKEPSALMSRFQREADSQEVAAALRRVGILDEHNIPVWEQNATRYADAFMEKNFGGQESRRGSYRNFEIQDRLPMRAGMALQVNIPKLTGVIYSTDGFSPAVPPDVTYFVPPLTIAPAESEDRPIRTGPTL